MADEIVMRQLTIRSFHCDKVEWGDEYSFKKDGSNYSMTLKKGIEEDMKNELYSPEKVLLSAIKEELKDGEVRLTLLRNISFFKTHGHRALKNSQDEEEREIEELIAKAEKERKAARARARSQSEEMFNSMKVLPQGNDVI